MDQILPYFPDGIDTFVDLFCGGCNVGMNVKARHTVYNDTSRPLIGLLRTLKRMRPETVTRRINALIDEYGLSRTRDHDFAYYGGGANLGVSVYNRERFLRMRERFNSLKRKDNQYYIMLYTLIVFGFNNQLRFNDDGMFNLPVGKRDFNRRMQEKLSAFMDRLATLDAVFLDSDFRTVEIPSGSFVYADPPYLVTTATYNEKDGWTAKDEQDLLALLDRLNARGLRFALSNVLEHEGKRNVILQDWLGRNRYRTHELFMDYHYSNYQKKSRAADSKEVLITNF